MTLTDPQIQALRDIVRAAIDQGAACQRLKSFDAAEPGAPLRSVYEVMTEQAIAAMEAVESAPVLGSIEELAYFINKGEHMSGVPLSYLSMDRTTPPAERAKQRPANFESLSVQEQWAIDKRLGILDWDGR